MKELISNLEELNRKAEKGGGDARIEKQHSVGKLTARCLLYTSDAADD